VADDIFTIRIAAAVIEREDGHLLFVRKRGTTAFMQPGGKLEADEPADWALSRELKEELGLHIDADSLTPIGRFSAPAANEPGHRVDAWVFDAPLRGEPSAQAEIEELAWIDPRSPGALDLAPLSRDVLIPLILHRRR